MTTPEKPHYVYVSRTPDGFNLVIMSRKQELQEQPLTADLAMKFAKDFIVAATELHKKEVTQAGNSEKQIPMFGEASDVQSFPGSQIKPRDNAEGGGLSTIPPV